MIWFWAYRTVFGLGRREPVYIIDHMTTVFQFPEVAQRPILRYWNWLREQEWKYEQPERIPLSEQERREIEAEYFDTWDD